MSNATPQPSARPVAPPTMPVPIFNPKVDGSDYYFYTVNPGSMAPAAQVSTTLVTDSATDFYWIGAVYMADLAGAAVTNNSLIVPLVTVLVYDGGSQRQLMDSPVPINNIASPRAAEPYRFIAPRLVVANTSLKFTFVNYSAATTYSNIYLTLLGYRRWAGT